MFKLLIFSLFMINVSYCFVPAKIISGVLDSVNLKFSLDFGQVGPTYPHEEILRRGLLRSIVKFFHEQPNGNKTIDMSQMDNEYLDIDKIYSNYYNQSLCDLPVEKLINTELGPNVAIVDIDPVTKDLPYAHFDAETFNQSNSRVVSYISTIYNFLNIKDYGSARKFSAQILHTIQDFYSHSNWVEMNMTSINMEIGKTIFSSTPIIDNVTSACNTSCTITRMGCGKLISVMLSLIQLVGFGKDKYTVKVALLSF
jgi:hypothetical protein